MMWVNSWIKHNKKWCVASLALLCVALVYLVATNLLSANQPITKVVRTTAHLQQTIARMNKTLDDISPPEHVAKIYLRSLATVQHDCVVIVRVQEKTSDGLSAEAKGVLSDTVALCNDLSELARASEATYQAVLPVLAIDTRVKRYQTLPYISQFVRGEHSNKITAALRALRQDPIEKQGFPSLSEPVVVQLKEKLGQSTDFSYKPALASAQSQLLAERQHYWTSFGSIYDLIDELDRQLQRYCGLAELENQHAICNNTEG